MKYILITLCTSFIFSCSAKKADLEQVPNSNNQATEASPVGPYTVAFDQSRGGLYEHTFQIPIAQDGGHVDYFISTERNEVISLDSMNVFVGGCDASRVKYQAIWYPDETLPTSQFVKVSTQFTTKRQTKGKLVFVFSNLNGCKDFGFKLNLRQLPHAGQAGKACEGSTGILDCVVEVYCREKHDTNYVEVEVWNHNNNLTLQKYMNGGDGQRSLMNSNSARVVKGSTETYYSSTTANSAALRFNNTSLIGVFSETIVGQNFSYDLVCDL